MSKGVYKEVKGDIFEPFEEDLSKNLPIIIPHVCNNIGAWGKGFTKSLDLHLPSVKDDYFSLRARNRGGLKDTLFIPVGDVVVACMVAQVGLPSPTNRKPLSYSALCYCMEDVLYYTRSHRDINNIWCPKFGCGLAGGNWDFIEELIEELWVDNGLNVTVFILRER